MNEIQVNLNQYKVFEPAAGLAMGACSDYLCQCLCVQRVARVLHIAQFDAI